MSTARFESPVPESSHHHIVLRTIEACRLAKEAAAAFEYKVGSPGLQTEGHPPRVLDNTRTLAEEHVRNGEKLELVDTGGGVGA